MVRAKLCAHIIDRCTHESDRAYILGARDGNLTLAFRDQHFGLKILVRSRPEEKKNQKWWIRLVHHVPTRSVLEVQWRHAFLGNTGHPFAVSKYP